MEEWPPIWREAVSILIKQLWTADKWWSSSFRVGELLTTPECKKTGLDTQWLHLPQARTEPLTLPENWIRDMRFGTWNERNLYGYGSP
jgi:hypothetical protein